MKPEREPGTQKRPLSKAFWLQLIIGGLIGYFSFWIFDRLFGSLEIDSLIAKWGLKSDIDLSFAGQMTLTLAGLWVFTCFLHVVLFALTFFSPQFGAKMGILQMLGGANRGRISLGPLLTFYLASGGVTLLLTASTVLLIKGPLATAILVMGIILSGLLVWSAARLWQVLDELLKIIWVEAVAVTCGLYLTLGGFLMLANLLGIMGAPSGFLAFILFHWLYLLVYLVIMWQRAPDMLTSPTLEAE